MSARDGAVSITDKHGHRLEWPLLATCGVCGGSLEIYPYPAPAGSGYCQKCSPAWLRSFLEFATKDTALRGWKPRTERDQ